MMNDENLFYGFRQTPFEKETVLRKPFESDDTVELNSRLDFLLKTKGIGLLTGAPGTGKTYALRRYIEKLNPAVYKVAYIQLSTLSVTEYYRTIARELGLEAMYRKTDLFYQIQEEIRYQAVEKRRMPIIILDEAQYLPNEVLRDLVMLFNFDMDSKSYCTVLLCGAPNLLTQLRKQIHEPLRQRIAMQHTMEGLRSEEAIRYIRYVLKECGREEELFTEEACRCAGELCSGSVRKLNNILRTALVHGAAFEKPTLSADDIRIVDEDFKI